MRALRYALPLMATAMFAATVHADESSVEDGTGAPATAARIEAATAEGPSPVRRATGVAAEVSTPDEASLRAADREQLRILLERDLDADAAMLHPNFVLNGDGSSVLRRRQALERMARRPQQMDRFERTIEAVTITDRVGVVTGTELVLGAPGSDLRVRFGDAVLERRFTNVYFHAGDRWTLLARQATPVQAAPLAPTRKLLLGTAPPGG
jgi:hypothetical protein